MRVAVVGSGVTGLAATWLLNEYSPHEAHLYEADGRPGGHANTVYVTQPGKEPVAVDTGFIVFNPPTYPNFLRFLALHKHSVEVIKTQMTFSVSRDGGAFEWAGDGLRSVFCQPRRVFDLGMWRMLFDIMRFNACAVRVLAENDDLSIGEYLQREGYSSQFRDDYLIPMTAAVWSTPPDVCAIDFPAKTLIRFMYNHHLLQITGKPSWLTIKGGSKKYVESVLSQLPAAQLHLSTPVHAIWSGEGSTILEMATGKRETFDHIIFACHSDDALRILDAGSGATPAERETLGAFCWSRNEVWLHSDESLMPRSRLAWSCWNYITRTTVDEKGMKKANDPQVSLTDWMNDLQRLSSQKHGDLFATLNPLFPPSPTRVLGHYTYAHPVLSANAVRAQRRLAQLNAQAAEAGSGQHRAFAGAWTRYGFHEDGFVSGLRVAAALPDVAPPFAIADADVERGEPRVGTMARLFDVLEVVRAFAALLVGRVLFVMITATSPVDQKMD
ncbi:amine oxidase [Russula ochroleuca]|uniref:Amine oxidase n=1 Tax=Russula ochroleuca TaxID=152965 RepID=A0A9P5MZ58_9AGAM|nr:amine oxidase [Russula ochroleuca]